ncbi:GntP family permease [Streptomyces spectabilis]|uniref:Gluconate transporter n=1 Tax=Streptomyces spectabilis TaxID=68270 RepID=A0A5P2X8T9_STRST|nr:gluconate:H+ symporter [Streptomyces spectabilis]MBB5106009.1 GntP family gluconate:H+ symporter [Streptomyces spectabilis]MCI3901540.1 GntP family permease [Streptomyces spectabilis]QEV58996.1 gluconate transporter [Streptomyces spectabilis]GGV25417.1 gluconate:H+ symporter, GntP family protein [Streptomyces spectabilis]
MTSLSVEMLAADPVEPITSAGHAQLGIAVLAGIAVIVLLITKFKVHAFLALTIGSLSLGAFAGAPLDKAISSFTTGLGSTVAGVGVLIALGAILGKLLADSGGADQIVDTILAKAGGSGGRAMPWAMVLIASVIGLPLFFEVGIVLLIPVVLMVAKRGNYSLMRIGIPALAGLSVMHGLIPPHPEPLVAIDAVKANLGVTLALGVLVAIPTVIVAGPLFSKVAARWVDVAPPEKMIPQRATDELEKRPGFGATVATVLLPVVLMLAKALVDIVVDDPDATVQRVFDVIGSPLIALLAAVLVGMFTLGRAAGFTKERLSTTVEKSLAPIAGVLMIVGAGGGFKTTLIDVGVGQMILDFSEDWSIPALLLAWLIAVAIRLATGSATVATISAAGLVAPLAADMSTSHTALLVLAIGAGSLFFSHVNDAGFWLVKEYFGLDVGQTIKTWSVMETIISVVALGFVMLLSLVL